MSSERRLIYHVFADHGVESEALATVGDVVRVGLDPTNLNASEPVRADARSIPLQPGADLVVLHPTCARWAETTSISGDPDDHPDLIPLARELGRELGEHYIIENVPRAPLRDPVTLTGDMFGLPIRYARAFETSFPVGQPSAYRSIPTEVSSYFYSDRSREWWAATKGYSGAYTKIHLAKNCIPSAYIEHLLRAYLRETGDVDGRPARADPADPDPKRVERSTQIGLGDLGGDRS